MRDDNNFDNGTDDRTLYCVDCCQKFTWTASEQTFYRDRQFKDPKRCKGCRFAKRAQYDG